MKTLDEYLSYSYKMEIIKDEEENCFVASFPDLKGCLTCGSTTEEACKNAEDAKREWIIAAYEDGYPIPEPQTLDNYSGQFKLRIPKSLHRDLAVRAKNEGISMNQLCLYALSRA